MIGGQFCFFCTLLLVIVFMTRAVEAIQLKNCDVNAPIQLSLTHSPPKILLKNNATFYVSAGFQIKNFSIPKRLRVLVDVSKKMLIWVKIPCVGCDFSLSCQEKPEICMFSDMCRDCGVHVKNIKIRMPHNVEQLIPTALPNFAVNGFYWVKLNVVNEDDQNQTVACIEITTGVKSYA